jgi:hypothetical protein
MKGVYLAYSRIDPKLYAALAEHLRANPPSTEKEVARVNLAYWGQRHAVPPYIGQGVGVSPPDYVALYGLETLIEDLELASQGFD